MIKQRKVILWKSACLHLMMIFALYLGWSLKPLAKRVLSIRVGFLLFKLKDLFMDFFGAQTRSTTVPPTGGSAASGGVTWWRGGRLFPVDALSCGGWPWSFLKEGFPGGSALLSIELGIPCILPTVARVVENKIEWLGGCAKRPEKCWKIICGLSQLKYDIE